MFDLVYDVYKQELRVHTLYASMDPGFIPVGMISLEQLNSKMMNPKTEADLYRLKQNLVNDFATKEEAYQAIDTFAPWWCA